MARQAPATGMIVSNPGARLTGLVQQITRLPVTVRQRLAGRKQGQFLLLLAMLSSIASCAYLKAPVVPMAIDTYHHANGNTTLVMLLPGLGDIPQDFVSNGVVDEIRRCRPDANIVGARAYYGYYRDNILLQRLREDIVLPAREAGVDEIWLIGVSMGGIGSLLYRLYFPDEIAGVILMAPYLGEYEDFRLYLENPGRRSDSLNPEFVDLWDGLVASAASSPEITLAYGEDDDFHVQLDWFAQLLGKQRAISRPGGHSWAAWRSLWPDVLARSSLCQAPDRSGAALIT